MRAAIRRRSSSRPSCRRSARRSSRCGVDRSVEARRAVRPGPADARATLPAMTIERVFVAGAGLMGHGIAQVHAAIGKQVVLYEPDARPRRGRPGPHRRQPAARGRQGPPRRGRPRRHAGPDRADRRRSAAAADADLVIEAVFEDLGVKSALWRELDGLAPPGAIFASNTSSIAIHRLAESVSTERRPRFVGMHFFSPVPVMPLVELIRSVRHVGRDGRGDPRSCRASSASRSSCRPTGRASSSIAS